MLGPRNGMRLVRGVEKWIPLSITKKTSGIIIIFGYYWRGIQPADYKDLDSRPLLWWHFYHCIEPTKERHLSFVLFTVKKIYRIPVFFFTKPFRNGKTPMMTRDFFCPPEKEFFVFWGGKSIPLTAGVIFSSNLNVIFLYFPYFHIKFTGKLMEDSWLARAAKKFSRWEKNSAPFVKSVKISENFS